MNENFDLLEILKDCPRGTKLYSPLCGECTFDRLNYGTIICKKQNTQEITFTSEGYYMLPVFDDCECMIFPSKDQRDWSKFKVENPKFDPATLQPFDRVLVRDTRLGEWKITHYSHTRQECGYKYIASCSAWKHCIPYNDETKHLIGTKEMEPEFYQVDEYEL